MTQIPVYTSKIKPDSFFEYLKSHIRMYNEESEVIKLAQEMSEKIVKDLREEITKITSEKLSIGTEKKKVLITVLENETIPSALARHLKTDFMIELNHSITNIINKILENYPDFYPDKIDYVNVVRMVYDFVPILYETVEEIRLFPSIAIFVYNEDRSLFKIHLVGEVKIRLIHETIDYQEEIAKLEVKKYEYEITFPK